MLKFSLRAFLILIFLACLLVAWYGTKRHRVVQRTRMLQQLQEEGHVEIGFAKEGSALPNRNRWEANWFEELAKPPTVSLAAIENESGARSWFNFSWVDELQELSVHDRDASFVVESVKFLKNLRELKFLVSAKMRPKSVNEHLISDYLEHLPDLPHLETLVVDDRHRPFADSDDARWMTGQELIACVNKAPNLRSVRILLREIDRDTIALLKQNLTWESVHIQVKESSVATYHEMAQALLDLPRVKKLRLFNIIDQETSELAWSRAEFKKEYFQKMASLGPLKLTQSNIEDVVIVYLADMEMEDCPELKNVSGSGSEQLARIVCRRCPVLRCVASRYHTLHVEDCPKFTCDGVYCGRDWWESANSRRFFFKNVGKILLVAVNPSDEFTTEGPVRIHEMYLGPVVQPLPSIESIDYLHLESLSPQHLAMLEGLPPIEYLDLYLYEGDDVEQAWNPANVSELFKTVSATNLRVTGFEASDLELFTGLGNCKGLKRLSFGQHGGGVADLFLPDSAVAEHEAADRLEGLAARWVLQFPDSLEELEFWNSDESSKPFLKFIANRYPDLTIKYLDADGTRAVFAPEEE